MQNLNPHVGCCPLRPRADRACARFSTTRYYPLGVEKSGNGDRQVAAVAAPARGKTGPVPEITFLPSTLSRRAP